MKSIIILLSLLCFTGTTPVLEIDFGTEKGGTAWQIINDGVMGGLSQGTVSFSNNSLQFSGEVSLKNYGGFTAVKSPFKAFNLGKVSSIEVRYRSKGQDMAITLENSRAFFVPYYKVLLPKTDGEWQSIRIPIREAKGYSMGQPNKEDITTDFLDSILRIGIITTEKKEGDFSIELDYLRFN